ncbi:MAG TPA: nitrous-oxide reductase, partial [Acidobacteriota bacterium]
MKRIETKWKWIGISAVLVLAVSLMFVSCKKKEKPVSRSGVAEAAIATYVAPGDIDEYYLFYSGGHSGQVFVAGVPSMRHIATIPVFTPYPSTGYGFDKHSKEMLGRFTWGDAHHPSLSETKGDYDGRWLFISDNA